MKKVLIPTKLDKVTAELLGKEGFTVIQTTEKKIDELAREHSDAQVVIVRSEKVTAAIIDTLPKLRLVVRAGAGYDNIDIRHARRRNVDVMNTPGANSNAVAEEVIAMALAAYRHVIPADASTRAGGWEKTAFMGRELTGKTLGVVGMGNIGRLLVKRLQGFEMRILAYDPVLSADLAAKMGVVLSSVEDIFRQSDIISLHVPETDETRGMVGTRLLSMTKPGVVLINCARAGVVDEQAIRSLKAEKRLLFCNDVYPKDEPGPKSAADIADILLPHLGASTFEANFNAAKRAAEQTAAYFGAGVTTHVVNKGVPDGLDEQFQSLAFLLARLARNYLGGDTALCKIETSFYGNLQPFGAWMLAPIAAGISPEFDPHLDAADALSFFKQRGIEIVDREVDNAKRYGDSITIDISGGDRVLAKVSVRGTIAENNLMISRINNFDRLYLEPSGNNLFVEYSDEPGVIGKIASLLGKGNVNIVDLRAPQDLSIGNSLAAIKTNVPVPAEMQAQIRDLVKAKNVFSFSSR
jgi:D-3-phosphoglycerate dehydrogenase